MEPGKFCMTNNTSANKLYKVVLRNAICTKITRENKKVKEMFVCQK